MFVGQVKNSFLGKSGKPLVGTCYSHNIENSLKEAVISTDTQLVAGDPVVVLVSQANQATGMLSGFNPDSQAITAKASTVTGGAGTTDICGFLLVNSNDRVLTGGVGIPSQNQRALYAPIGQGAIVWLEVASANFAGFQTSLSANAGITLDSTNGGIKVAGSTDTAIAGAKVITGLIEAQKIQVVNGVGSLVDCFAVAIQLI